MRSNPFSTRYVRPGELAWIAAGDKDSLVALPERFQGPLRRRATIVGPHGCGKSTLLEHLISQLGAPVVRLSLRRSEQPYQKIVAATAHSSNGTILALDGFEQLSTWQAIRVCWRARRRLAGLLVTCHRQSRLLPTLITLAPTAELVTQLVNERLATAREKAIGDCDCPTDELTAQLSDPQMLQRWLAEERGSVREVFMRLYDLVEDHYANGINQEYSQR